MQGTVRYWMSPFQLVSCILPRAQKGPVQVHMATQRSQEMQSESVRARLGVLSSQGAPQHRTSRRAGRAPGSPPTAQSGAARSRRPQRHLAKLCPPRTAVCTRRCRTAALDPARDRFPAAHACLKGHHDFFVHGVSKMNVNDCSRKSIAQQVCDHVARHGLEKILAVSTHLIAQHESSWANKGVLVNFCSIICDLYPNNPAACTTPLLYC